MTLADVSTDPAVSIALPTPRQLADRYPMRDAAVRTVSHARTVITNILTGADPRLLVVAGPCSIHDEAAALQYAHWIHDVSTRYEGRLFLVMRAYVEKARTRLGWKGLLHDPRLDGSNRIDEGLARARSLLVVINDLGVPVATEIVEPSTPTYLADTISWAAIGARTVESPVHREIASGLPCPVGFKNATSGDVRVAVNAAFAARRPHRFVSIDANGHSTVSDTTGNAASHIILRGGVRPNYDGLSIANATALLRANGLPPRLIVDCSHGNCDGDYRNQLAVARHLAVQLAAGAPAIAGVMLESHLVEGRQTAAAGTMLYGQSITDACLGPEATLEALDALAEACSVP